MRDEGAKCTKPRHVVQNYLTSFSMIAVGNPMDNNIFHRGTVTGIRYHTSFSITELLYQFQYVCCRISYDTRNEVLLDSI